MTIFVSLKVDHEIEWLRINICAGSMLEILISMGDGYFVRIIKDNIFMYLVNC